MEPVGGISRYQKNLRLERCLRELKNPKNIHLSISEIAYRWGFKHPTTFSRNFRAAFDITPGEARSLGSGECDSQGFKLTTGDFKPQPEPFHHQWFHAIGL
jgi:AraC-like DNA-binding protein